MIGKKPLSEDELDELEKFLLSSSTPKKCMDIEALDGFLTAIVSGSDVIMPSEWLSVVWGDKEGPVFETEEQIQKIMGLIMRHMNSLANTLMDYPEKYKPLIHEWDSKDFYLTGLAWAAGYIKGMELRLEEWRELTSNKDYADMFMPILTLTAKKDEPEFGELVNTQEKRQRFIDMLPESVCSIYDFWLDRREPAYKPEPIRKQQKVGRNEPCPCGSGKKYKKCCGAPERFH